MLKNWKFAHKTMSLPVVAAAGFLFILVVSWVLGARNTALLTQMESGHFNLQHQKIQPMIKYKLI